MAVLREQEKFGRLVVLQLNNEEFRSGPGGFSITARVTMKKKRRSEASIQLYNPPEEVIRRVLAAKRSELRVRLLAGYVGDDYTANPPVVFDGNIIRDGGRVEYAGADRVLKLTCKEGAISLSKRVNIRVTEEIKTVGEAVALVLSEALGADVEQQFDAVRGAKLVTRESRAFGLDIGLQSFASTASAALPKGMHFEGPAWEVLQRVGDTLDVDIAVNRGYVEITERRKPRTLEGPLLSTKNRTLIDGPNPASKGKFRIQALLEPELITGDRFAVETLDGVGDGFYVCDEHTLVIDSGYGDAFDSYITARLDP